MAREREDILRRRRPPCPARAPEAAAACGDCSRCGTLALLHRSPHPHREARRNPTGAAYVRATPEAPPPLQQHCGPSSCTLALLT
eukprot:scaffold2752_cov393-Prasinococcus_capsulatus_cf.AAC.38